MALSSDLQSSTALWWKYETLVIEQAKELKRLSATPIEEEALNHFGPAEYHARLLEREGNHRTARFIRSQDAIIRNGRSVS